MSKHKAQPKQAAASAWAKPAAKLPDLTQPDREQVRAAIAQEVAQRHQITPEDPTTKLELPAPKLGSSGVLVRYIGEREEWHDTLYWSGLWERDQTREVEPHIAHQLLQHSEFEDARPDGERGTPIKFDPKRLERYGKEADLEDDNISDLPQLADVNMMTKPNLVQYAHRNFGVQLSERDNKDALVTRVRHLMNQRGMGARWR